MKKNGLVSQGRLVLVLASNPQNSTQRVMRAYFVYTAHEIHTYLRDVHEAGAAVLEAEEGAVAHDVLYLGGDELARVLINQPGNRQNGCQQQQRCATM